MKTFEERYTAWIDGALEGPALTSFELELSRRASAGEARADKSDAAKLHRLLTTHLKAPAMTNAEFFSHQLRERIEAERGSERRRGESRQARGSIFSWPFARLAGLSAACLFVAAALYYGMVPQYAAAPTPAVAVINSAAAPNTTNTMSAAASVPEMPVAAQTAHSSDLSVFAQASPMPPRVDLNNDIQVARALSPKDTSVTPLPLKDPNASVLWVNGLDYTSTVPGESPAATTPNASAKP